VHDKGRLENRNKETIMGKTLSKFSTNAVCALLVLASEVVVASDQPVSGSQPSPAPTATSVPAANVSAQTPFYVGEELHLFDLVTSYGSFVTGKSDNICSLPDTTVRVLKIESGDASSTYGPLIDVIPLHGGKMPKGVTTYPGCDNDKFLNSGGGLFNVYDSNLEQSRYNAEALVTGILAVPYKFHLSDHSATVGTTIGGYVGYQMSFQNLFTATPILGMGLALVSSSPAQVNSSTTGTNGGKSPASQTSNGATNAGVSLATGFIGTVSNQGKGGLQYGLVIGIDWVGKTAHYAYEGKPWLAAEIGYNFSTAPSSSSGNTK